MPALVAAGSGQELAQETAKATEGIGKRIETIQSDGATTVSAASKEATTAADETRGAAGELAVTAVSLQTIVSRFQISPGEVS